MGDDRGYGELRPALTAARWAWGGISGGSSSCAASGMSCLSGLGFDGADDRYFLDLTWAQAGGLVGPAIQQELGVPSA